VPSFGKGGVVDLKAGVVYGDGKPIDLEKGEIGLHSTPTVVKDVIGVLLIVSLLPLWMAVGLGVVVVVVGRQLYWWASGNTTVVSRLARR